MGSVLKLFFIEELWALLLSDTSGCAKSLDSISPISRFDFSCQPTPTSQFERTLLIKDAPPPYIEIVYV